MTANAQAQVERMLALVPYLRERDGISVDEVARDFNVKPTQIVKDLNVLWFCGLPDALPGDMIDVDMEALEGEGVVRLSNAEFLRRPLRLAPYEALALVVSLRALWEGAGDTEQQAIERALAKLEAAAGGAPAAAAAVDVWMDPVDAEVRSAVDQALHEDRRLHLRYYVPGRDETTERDVDPIRLVITEGHAYLEAWCHRVQDVRFFRLDRMVTATLLDEAASPPSGASRGDVSQGLFQPAPDDPVAVLDLDRSAAWLADYYPLEERIDLPEGRLRVTLRVRDYEWLVRLALRMGGGARVIEPAEVTDAVRERARAALARYEP